METKHKESDHTTEIVVLLLGIIGLIIVIALDKLFWRTDILAEGWPNFSLGYLTRSSIIFISILAIFFGLIGRKRPKLKLVENNGVSIEILSILGILSISTLFLYLFLSHPYIFYILSKEDSHIEGGSALLLFSSSVIFIISSLKCRNKLNIPRITKWSLVFLALVFLLIGLEEVSWFQRILNFETPTVFDGNLQKEFNLHNFATNYIENIYYFGAFIFLVILPFIRLLYPDLSKNNYLRIFIARPFIAVLGATFCVYNFDMWNIIFTQMVFFASIVILFAFAIFSSIRFERYFILLAIFLMIIKQALFLSNGSNFYYEFQITESKEFLIPLTFLIYSLDVSIYINRAYFTKMLTKQ